MRLSDFDLKALRVFRAVVENRGFAGAQVELGLSQPTISQQVKALEERLGFTLCRRGRAGFQLSEKGEQVYKKAKRLLEEIEDYGNALTELRGRGSAVLRVGLVDSTATDPEFDSAAILRRFHDRMVARGGEAHVKLNVASTEVLEKDLASGALQVAIAPLVNRLAGFDYEELYRERHGLYAGRGHPLFGRRNAPAEAFEEARFVSRSYLQQRDAELLRNKHIAATVGTMEAQALLILSGHYIGFLPDHYAKLWVERGELSPLLPDRAITHSPFVLAAKHSAARPKVVETFIEAAREVCGECHNK